MPLALFLHPPAQLSAHTTNVTEGEILSADEAVLIGDRLYTDIACGLNAGISAMLVLSGEATMDDVENDETYSGKGTTGGGILLRGLGDKSGNQNKVLLCPSVPGLFNAGWAGSSIAGYGYNEFLGAELAYGASYRGMKTTQVRRPSAIVTFADCGYLNDGREELAAQLRAPVKRLASDADLRSSGTASFRHAGSCNAGFADGHGENRLSGYAAGVSGVDGKRFGFLSEDNSSYDPACCK